MFEMWVPKAAAVAKQVARYEVTDASVRVVHADGSEFVQPVTSLTRPCLRRVATRIFRSARVLQ